MAVTYLPPERIDWLTWRVKFSSDQPTPVPFRVVRDGRVVSRFDSSTGAGQHDFPVGFDEPIVIEVLDKAGARPGVAFEPRILLHWAAVASAVSYRIDEYISAAWVARDTIADRGEGYFAWFSRALEDTVTHQFRIMPIDAAGNDGTAIAKTVFQVRHPDVPAASFGYNGAATPTVTVTGA